MSKKIFLIGFIVTLLIAIPASLIAVKTSTQNTSKANPATSLAFSQPNQTVSSGQAFSMDVTMNPGTNQVSFIKLVIAYDSSKVAKGDTGIVPNTSAFPNTLQGPTYDQCSGNNCTMSVTLGAEPAKPITTPTTIATLNFKTIGANGTSTQISFSSQTQVLSTGQSDQQSENVLSTVAPPANITIGNQAQLTISPTGSPSPTGGIQTSPTPTNTALNTNVAPSCTSLSANPTSGTSPLTTDITAAGGDSDGTISKVTFDFGDGNTQDITSGGGLGTASVSVDATHTYQNTGTYTATATFTDNSGATSTTTNCSQTITIGSNITNNNTSTSDATITDNTTATVSAQPTLPITGPETMFFGLGALGLSLAGVGIYLFFAL